MNSLLILTRSFRASVISLLLLTPIIWAQLDSSQAIIEGVVRSADPTLSISGTKVTLEQKNRSVVKTTITDSIDRFVFKDVPLNQDLFIGIYHNYLPVQYYHPVHNTKYPSYPIRFARGQLIHIKTFLVKDPDTSSQSHYYNPPYYPPTDKNTPPYSSLSGKISGLVFDKTDGKGLTGCTILALPAYVTFYSIQDVVSPYSSMTDAWGRYVIEKIPPGSYFVLARKDSSDYTSQFYSNADFIDQAKLVHICDTCNVSGINFNLKIGGKIIGRVYSTDNRPIENVELCLTDNDHRNEYRGRTTADGAYIIRGLPNSKYILRMVHESYFPATEDPYTIEIANTATLNLKPFYMKPAGFMSGTLNFEKIQLQDSLYYYNDILFYFYHDSISVTQKNLEPVVQKLYVPRIIEKVPYKIRYPSGTFKVFVVAPPLSKRDSNNIFDSISTFAPNMSWGGVEGILSFSKSPSLVIKAYDTLSNINLRLPSNGYSVFGSVRFKTPIVENEGSSTIPQWYSVAAYVKEEGILYRVSESWQLPNGRFELPGLRAEQDYFLLVNADRCRQQYWSPRSGNTIDAAIPYYFSATPSSFVPLDIVVDQNLSIFHSDSVAKTPYCNNCGNVLPISLSIVKSDPSSLVLGATVAADLKLDSLVLYCRNEQNKSIQIISAEKYSPKTIHLWTVPSAIIAKPSSYIVVGKNLQMSLRSNVEFFDASALLNLSADSLWIKTYETPFGIHIKWGHQYNLLKDNLTVTDSVFIYRNKDGNWRLLRAENAWASSYYDNNLDRHFDRGKTIYYKVEIKIRNRIRKTNETSFTITSAFINQLSRRLEVGPGREFGSIMAAVDAARPFDEICVFPTGKPYTEPIDFKGKILTIRGIWDNGMPIVLDAKGGVAIKIPFISTEFQWPEVPIINGFKITNGKTGIYTASNCQISNCLFTNLQYAIEVDVDSAAIALNIAKNPFASPRISVQCYENTFVGKTTQNISRLIKLNSKQGIDPLPLPFLGNEASVLLSSGPSFWSEGNISNSQIAFYEKAPIIEFGGSGSKAKAHIYRCNFWNSLIPQASPNIYTENKYEENPYFEDTTFYFLPVHSRFASLDGGYIGYDRWRKEKKDTVSHPIVKNIEATVVGFNSIRLRWNAISNTTGFNRYVVLRLPNVDQKMFFANNSGAWEPVKKDSILPLIDTFSTRDTTFLDTTVIPDIPYLYTVVVIDSAGRMGPAELPSSIPLTAFIRTISYSSFQNQFSLSAKQWHMIGPWGIKALSLPTSSDIAIFRWNDKKEPDKLLSQYEIPDSLRPCNGYWIRSDTERKIVVDSFSYSLLLQKKTITINLTAGKSGWHQISSPFPFPIAPQWLSSYTLFEWLPTQNTYTSNIKFLKPWTAYWLYTGSNAVLTFEQTPRSTVSGVLSKRSTIKPLWEIELFLQTPNSADQENMLGLINGSPENNSPLLIPEPPAALDYPQLFFINENAESSTPLYRISSYYKAQNQNPSEKLLWPVCISPSKSKMKLIFKGIESLPSQIQLYWIQQGAYTKISATTQIVFTPSEQPAYGYVLALKKATDMALYSGQINVYGNYPNPFRNATAIKFIVPYEWEKDGRLTGSEYRTISLDIFNLSGRKIASLVNGKVAVGYHTTEWKASETNTPAGLYFARLQSGSYKSTLNMLLIK